MPQKPQTKETSGLSSLKELMSIEEDRIKQEEEDKRRRADAELAARTEAERRAREEEQARLVAEEERRRSDEQRKKEEAARLEAIRHAEIEKARIEAEQKGRLETLSRQQEHERSLQSMQHDQHKKKLQRMVGASIGGAILLAVVGGIVIHNKTQEAERQAAIAAEAARTAAEENAKLKKQMDEAQAKIDVLVGQLGEATNDAQRAELKAKIQAEKDRQAALKAAPRGGGGAAPDKAKPPCKCQPGDPMCSCL